MTLLFAVFKSSVQIPQGKWDVGNCCGIMLPKVDYVVLPSFFM